MCAPGRARGRRNQRLTFFECPNDMNAMIDLAKIADLVVLIIDASFGFEMETFEFLNILQARYCLFGWPFGALLPLLCFSGSSAAEELWVTLLSVHCIANRARQVHGFPKIIGVLTHLDDFRHNKRLQKTKKRLKQRFWAEIYHGAKLFYLSRVVRGRYPKPVRIRRSSALVAIYLASGGTLPT